MLSGICGLVAVPEAGSRTVHQERQRIFISTSFLTFDSYPEIRITPYAAVNIIAGNEDYPPAFAPPANILPITFDSAYSVFMDTEERVECIYMVSTAFSYESCIVDEDATDKILESGADVSEMHIDVRDQYACALFPMTMLGDDMKLKIVISQYG